MRIVPQKGLPERLSIPWSVSTFLIKNLSNSPISSIHISFPERIKDGGGVIEMEKQWIFR